MKRREILVMGTAGVLGAGFVGGVLDVDPIADSESGPKPVTTHYGNRPIAYTHEQLRLRALSSTASIGETIAFEVTNTSESTVTLGCGNPWTIQKKAGGQWRDLLWTSATAFTACASPLPAGASTTERVTLSKSALENQSDTLRLELTPGTYRFVLLATEPFLATGFRVTPSN